MLWIVDNDRESVYKQRRRLYGMGFFTEAVSYRTLGSRMKSYPTEAVIVPRPMAGDKPARFARSFKAKHPGIPLIYLNCDKNVCNDHPDLFLSEGMHPKEFKFKLMQCIYKIYGKDTGNYIGHFFEDNIFADHTVFSSIELELSHRCRMVLRYILYAEPASYKDILRFAVMGEEKSKATVIAAIKSINLSTRIAKNMFAVKYTEDGYIIAPRPHPNGRRFPMYKQSLKKILLPNNKGYIYKI